MKKSFIITLLLVLCSFFSLYNCKKEPNGAYIVKNYKYNSLTIPSFFKAVVKNHTNDFFEIDKIEYANFCKKNQLLVKHALNKENYFTISILHQLFTCQSPSNGSKGAILSIPYMWHWTNENPNPRHEISFCSNNTLLRNTKPPIEFAKYKSYADIDRTPYLFISDMVAPELKYYTKSCGKFASFGWCSEREMAFTALITLLNFNGYVRTEYAHSKSELLIPMNSTSGSKYYFLVTVDNTYDSISWLPISNRDSIRFKNQFTNSMQSDWYNSNAKSPVELSKISNHYVSNKAMINIENRIVNYLKSKITSGNSLNN